MSRMEVTRAYLQSIDVPVIPYPTVGSTKAVTIEVEGKYGIFLDRDKLTSQEEELVVLVHEAGHVSTGATHTVHSPFELIAKNEAKANRWAVHVLLPFEKLLAAIRSGCHEAWQLAAEFELPESFIRMAISVYRLEGKLPS